jgi:hypothetical protein
MAGASVQGRHRPASTQAARRASIHAAWCWYCACLAPVSNPQPMGLCCLRGKLLLAQQVLLAQFTKRCGIRSAAKLHTLPYPRRCAHSIVQTPTYLPKSSQGGIAKRALMAHASAGRNQHDAFRRGSARKGGVFGHLLRKPEVQDLPVVLRV